MFSVYFRNSRGIDRLLAEVDSKREVNLIIFNFLADHNYKSYYSRWWREPNGDWICDVGSWSEFFVVKGADETFMEKG